MGNLPGWFLKELVAKPKPKAKSKRPHYLYFQDAPTELLSLTARVGASGWGQLTFGKSH